MLKRIIAQERLSGLAHITGGGIPGNLPRVLPRGTQAVIELGSWPVPPIFKYLASVGRLERDELLSTFNMGVGMILIVPPEQVRAVEGELKRRREAFYRIGSVRRSDPSKPRVAFTGQLPL
jgi:phosphoribosylformylglycinamidine cyclo-ligase